MAEPTTAAATTAITLSAASLLPFVNGNALLGAVFGAALFATTKKDLKPLQRLVTMILATGIGYLLTPEIITRTMISNDATAGMVAAIFSLPIILKAIVWVDQSNLSDIFNKFRGGGTS
ncbi:putative holin [Acinetobacter sp. VNK23]|uniref:putative holin n=1 Tax=Acinetobacter thutiue TaxID=2998078 RepID=UPI002575CB1C|nr:putative holin [Acinetobacter thutiue]MDM1022064.1 putative holin [Acinetobacter thutiue]